MVQNALRGPDWRKIQVSLEIAVEIVDFLNIDLFDTGIYQIRASLKCDGKVPYCIEVSTHSKKSSSSNGSENGLFTSAFIQQNSAPYCSTFRVRYPQQHVSLQDVLLYRVFLLVDPLAIEEAISKTEYTLLLDILHVGRENDDTVRTSVGERTLKFSVKPGGLHFHREVLFGYTNFCQLSLSVHATLIALQEPYRKFQLEVKPNSWKKEAQTKFIDVSSQSTMNVIIFGAAPESVERVDSQELISGKQRVIGMCLLLITALEALQAKYVELQHLVDETYNLDAQSTVDCQLLMTICTSEIEAAIDRETLIESGQKLVTQMAGEVVRLWTNFVEAYIGCINVSQYLMEGFRRSQLGRLGEGVFVLDHHKSYLTSKSESQTILARHDAVWDLLKRSKYYTELLPLPVACIETDGRPSDVPVIFEDRYYHIESDNGSPKEATSTEPSSSVTPEKEATLDSFSPPVDIFELPDVAILNGIVAVDEEQVRVRLKSVKKFDESDQNGRPRNVSKSNGSVNDNGLREHDSGWMQQECSLAEMLRGDPRMPPVPLGSPQKMITHYVKDVLQEEVAFQEAKAVFKSKCLKIFNGLLFSDYPLPKATHSCVEVRCARQSWRSHLIVCVHGLEGTHEDMKLVRTYLERALPMHNIDFLMSRSVSGSVTYRNLEHLTEVFVYEVVDYLAGLEKLPEKISFVGHSLGALLVRAIVSHPAMEPYLASLYTFLSFCGPHFGLINNPSKIVSTGLWFFLKWRKAESLNQLALRDAPDMRQSFIYQLSQRDKSHHFQHILLVSSAQDHYAPYYSARIEPISVRNDLIPANSTVQIHNEMAANILGPIAGNQRTKVIRYDVRVPSEGASTPDNITGRLAHIAVIDSEIFLEKFMTVNVQYFV